MMRDESDYLLDDLLYRWHVWSRGYQLNPTPRADPTFRQAQSGRRNWDSLDEIIDDDLSESTMQSIEFQVSGDREGLGGMDEPHKSAIYANARNLASKAAVWSSPRLPSDPAERAILILEARSILMRRLLRAGVM